LFEAHVFTSFNLGKRFKQLVLVLGRQSEALVGPSCQDRDERTLWEGGPLDDDTTVYNCACDDLHDGDGTPEGGRRVGLDA